MHAMVGSAVRTFDSLPDAHIASALRGADAEADAEVGAALAKFVGPLLPANGRDQRSTTCLRKANAALVAVLSAPASAPDVVAVLRRELLRVVVTTLRQSFEVKAEVYGLCCDELVELSRAAPGSACSE